MKNVFGEFLRTKREKMDISQKEISDLLGWGTPQFISNCERGKAMLPMQYAKKVAKRLNINPKDMEKMYLDQFKAKLKKYL